MDNLEINNPEEDSTGPPGYNASSPEPKEPPLPGAKELGEKLEATLIEIAQMTDVINYEREKAENETFDERNLANLEWQLLEAKGRGEREADTIETEKKLAKLAKRTQSMIQHNYLDFQRYAEEVQERRAKEVEEVQIRKTQLEKESEFSIQKIMNNKRHFQHLNENKVSNFKQETETELSLLQDDTEKAIVEMVDAHQNKMEAIKVKHQQIVEGKLRQQEEQKLLEEEFLSNNKQHRKSEYLGKTCSYPNRRDVHETSVMGSEVQQNFQKKKLRQEIDGNLENRQPPDMDTSAQDQAKSGKIKKGGNEIAVAESPGGIGYHQEIEFRKFLQQAECKCSELEKRSETLRQLYQAHRYDVTRNQPNREFLENHRAQEPTIRRGTSQARESSRLLPEQANGRRKSFFNRFCSCLFCCLGVKKHA